MDVRSHVDRTALMVRYAAVRRLPCAQVVATEEQAATDYVVSCADGDLYRMYLNAAGRVVVEKRK